MSTEARIVSPQQKIGARPTPDSGGAPAEKPAKGGKKKLTVIIAIILVVALGAAYWFLAGPGAPAPATDPDADAAAVTEPEYELGEVLPIEAISVNLVGGHYLRLGFGLQLIAGAGGEEGPIDPSKALDAAIALFSGRTTEELSDPAVREELKHDLEEQLFDLYHEEVVAVYYTDFVTQ